MSEVSNTPSRWWWRIVLSVVAPWYILWRLRQLATNPEPEPQDMDEWDRGYQRAMSEIRLNIGLEKWS